MRKPTIFITSLVLLLISCSLMQVPLTGKAVATATPIPSPTPISTETSVCPKDYVQFTTPNLVLASHDKSRAIMVSDDNKRLSIILDKKEFSTENLMPDNGKKTVLQYFYGDTTYQDIVINVNGVLCFTERTVSSSSLIQDDGFHALEQNLAIQMQEIHGLHVIVSVSDDGKSVAVIIESNVVVSQALTPNPGEQVELQFNIGPTIYTAIVGNDNGIISYRLLVPSTQSEIQS